MPAHLYIIPWKWEQAEDFTGWARPNNGRILWDLRNYTQGSQRGGVAQGYGLFAYRSQQTLVDAMYLGQDPQRELSLLERSEIETRLRITLSETRLLRVLKELLIVHGDPTYQNRWMPKRISRKAGWQLRLPDVGAIISDEWSLDHPAWAATQAIRFVGYRKYRALVAEGKLPIDMLRRWTGYDMLAYFGRMGDDLLPALVPPEYQSDGWLAPASTVLESFNKADSTTLGPDQTWTEWVGATKDSDGWTIVSNKAENLGGGGVASARPANGVSSGDHYCQAEVESFVGGTSFVGVIVRFASGDIADAWVIRYRNGSTLTWRTEKMLDGVLSNYSSVNEAAPGAGPLTMKATAQADDFLKFEIGGVQKDLVEMDALFTNLHGGIHAEAGNNRTRVDVWELTDLAAGDVTIAAVVMAATATAPNAALSISPVIGAQVMAATAVMPAALVRINGIIDAEVMSATAAMPNAALQKSSTIVAAVMAATALSPSATLGIGPVIGAQPMAATAGSPNASLVVSSVILAQAMSATAGMPNASLSISPVILAAIMAATALMPAASISFEAPVVMGVVNLKGEFNPAVNLKGEFNPAVNLKGEFNPAVNLKGSL